MIDLHSHILPGVDDGAKSDDDSLVMAEGLSRLGFNRVCCTPHVPWGTRVYSAAELNTRTEELKEYFQRESNMLMDVVLGAEHHVGCLLELLHQDQLITYPRGDTFLVEFPMSGFPSRLQDLLFRVQVKGLVPVLAHVERYREVQRDIQVLNGLKERGCHILVNLSSLAGGWDRQAKVAARAIVEAGLADAVSTDLHSVACIKKTKQGLDILRKLVGEEGLRRLTEENPAAIAGIEV